MRKARFQDISTRLDADVLCDRCGKTCVTDTSVFEGVETLGVESAHFKAQWGYSAKNLDGDNWSAELCQECAQKIYDFIEEGEGSGVAVDLYFGDLTYYGLEGTRKKLEKICQENVGMGAEEFLSYTERGEVPEGVPSKSLSQAIHFAKFYLKYKDIPEEEWLTT